MNKSDGHEKKKTPTAELKPIASGSLLQSKMWWITLLCLGVAGYLAWHSQRPSGTEVVIDFPEGHGLKPGDSLRYRGIEIGLVTSVELAEDLHGVQASVEVFQSAKGVAIEGSRFWIVRPQLSLTNISGLETAVGAKYIAVAPGKSGGVTQREFVGLKVPPTTELGAVGVEIVLQGKESFGVNPSSPVTYRGIRVGEIISVELGSDALHVEIRARIDQQFRPLLCKGSKFWKTSGVDFDFGLGGLHLSTESLATVAKGGVAFVTPETRNPADLEPISSGFVYELHEEAEDKWMRDAASIPLDGERRPETE